MGATVGVDVGGTFTDVVIFDGETITGSKLPTTPNQADAVIEALEGVPAAGSVFLHGTTIATNQLLEGRGATVALITSEGFEDVLEIGRQARPSLYDPYADRPIPLVARASRIGHRGDVAETLAAVRALGADSVAVALVRSYDDPSEERNLAAALGEVSTIPISLAAEVSPSFREFERVATTVLNAYLTPTVAGYLGALDDAVSIAIRMVMTSAGGLIPFSTGADLASRLVLSGPAAGVVAAAELGKAKGFGSVMSFDMGGTSTDVCRIEGQASIASARTTAGRVNRVPSMAIHTIGAGGGSIAWADPGGALRVGPRSAGSHPGPACYARGGLEAAVTDANLLLGSIPHGLDLGGRVTLDPEAARVALASLGDTLGLSVERTAAGIIEVVDNHMERALRAVSIEEGADPRESALVAFGGAGALHASRLAKALGMGTVLVPPLSGVFSALGLLLARPHVDVARTVLLPEDSDELTEAAGRLSEEARRRFLTEHGSASEAETLTAEVRYVGQSHELAVPLSDGWKPLREAFERVHEARFAFARSDEPIELVNLRCEVSGDPPLSWDALPRVSGESHPSAGTSTLLVDGVPREVAVWQRPDLPTGFSCEGPALVIERDSVIRLEEGDEMSVHEDGTVEIAT